MTNLIQFTQGENPTITSREVAEMVDREHRKVTRDIDTIMRHLGTTGIGRTSYFTSSAYIHEQNGQEYRQYLLTKKGCELYATRMTGEQGTIFAAAYIERFNEMEQTIVQINETGSHGLETTTEDLRNALRITQGALQAMTKLAEAITAQNSQGPTRAIPRPPQEGRYTATSIARLFNMSTQEFNNALKELGIIENVGSQHWKLTLRYRYKGYQHPEQALVYTDSGKDFVIRKLNAFGLELAN